MKHFCFLTGLYSRQDPLMIERQGYSLVKAGYKVTYICCDNYPNETKNGIQIISTGFVPKNRLKRFFMTKKVLLKKAIDVDADIYQISDPELISLVRPLQKKGKRVVFNLREYYPSLILQKEYIPSYVRSIVAGYYSRVMSSFLPQYDAVFTVTPQMVELLTNRHHTLKSYLLTNYPLIDHCFSLSKEDYVNRPNVLLYEGSIYAVSRQERVFDALSELENVHYVLAGKIEPGYEAIMRHKYWSEITFIDGFSKEQLELLFSKSTISNILRDFGDMDGSLGVIKLFESMAAALPVLLTDVPIYRKLVEKYHCGICVNPNDSKSIKNAIEYLITNKEEAYQMGQNGRKAVLEEYNWEKQAKTYLKVLNQL